MSLLSRTKSVSRRGSFCPHDDEHSVLRGANNHFPRSVEV